jgi:Fe-Mn family superoxide dismutase
MSEQDNTISLSRRGFLKASAGAAFLLSAGGISAVVRASEPKALPPLPWAENALEPVISAN